MPLRLEHSLLRVQVPALDDIDTSSHDHLFGMWSLFSKASHAVENGKRLENLSWRLWNRETFCCAPPTHTPRLSSSSSTRFSSCHTPSAQKASLSHSPTPSLSSSIDSVSSDDDDDADSSLPCMAPSRARATRVVKPVETRSRGHEKHITPTDLQKIVISINETPPLEPLDMPITPVASRPIALPTPTSHSESNFTLNMSQSPVKLESSRSHTSSLPTAALESSASTIGTTNSQASHVSQQSAVSDESSTTEMSTHSIVRGFVPGGAPSSYRSQTNLHAQPTTILKTSPSYHAAQPKKKGAMFTIGTSSGEEESSLDNHMRHSALSASLQRSSGRLLHASVTSNAKQTSFRDELAVARAAQDNSVFDTDDEDDEVSESAIEESAIEDDDDSSDWEDSDDGSGPSSSSNIERDLFQRVDSRPDLTSRRSLLTTLMHEPDRAKALANAASRSTPALRRTRATSPNGPAAPLSPEAGIPMRAPSNDYNSRTRPMAMPAYNSFSQQQLALSPRTTRRNMLSTELTESLRKNLLWERQHRSTGNLAALKRRHTSNDVRNLRQHPEPGPVMMQDVGARGFTNEYFHAGLGEYHSKGW